jgi:hypothetical protein
VTKTYDIKRFVRLPLAEQLTEIDRIAATPESATRFLADFARTLPGARKSARRPVRRIRRGVGSY